MGQEQLLSKDDFTKENSTVGSLDEGLCCDSRNSFSETVLPEDHCVSPVGVIEPHPAQGDMGVRTRVGRIVKPVNRLIENMTQSLKTLSPFGGVVRSLLK